MRRAIAGVLASGEPRLACELYATERFLDQAFGGLAGCRGATVPRSAADSVEVTAVVIDGEAATATAIPAGGPSAGQRIAVELVAAGDEWQVDSLRSDVPVGP